jgi:hypothetical protein
MLYALRHYWSPGCMLVSFKLETDESILLRKVGHGTTTSVMAVVCYTARYFCFPSHPSSIYLQQVGRRTLHISCFCLCLFCLCLC